MKGRIHVIVLFYCVLHTGGLGAQSPTGLPDSLPLFNPVANHAKETPYRLTTKNVVLPAALIGYGVLSLTNPALGNLNSSTRYEIGEHRPRKISADNYTQYLPAAMVYAFNRAGIKGEHDFTDRTLLLSTSQFISAAIVVPLKYSVKKQRPDGSNHHSFPSGHTATAFSTAHFLYREYRDKNRLLSLSGYPVAVFTGVYRTLNNKHWVGDVVAGAGIGILSTELAYWMQPRLSSLLRNNKQHTHTIVLP